MDCYIALQFGQTTDIQREIIPVSSIETVYVELPEATNIVFVWRCDDKVIHRKEYYPDKIQCNRRWSEIRKILGVDHQLNGITGKPIPMDLSEWDLLSADAQTEYRKDMIRYLHYPEDKT